MLSCGNGHRRSSVRLETNIVSLESVFSYNVFFPFRLEFMRTIDVLKRGGTLPERGCEGCAVLVQCECLECVLHDTGEGCVVHTVVICIKLKDVIAYI